MSGDGQESPGPPKLPAGANGIAEGDIARAARILRAGGLVAFPTETVYGLGAHAFDESAVSRVFEIKRRPAFDPLIVHLDGLDALDRVARSVPKPALELARRFWPGPLTLVLRKREELPGRVTAGRPTVAVRVPAHPVALALIREAGVPIAAPSANRFGRSSPTTAEHVRREFPEGLDVLLDGGPCPVGVESTVLGFGPGGVPRILRPGGVPVERIERILGPVRIAARSGGPAMPAPGMLERHYAPRTPLHLECPAGRPGAGERWGWIGPGLPADPGRFAVVESLGRDDSPESAAAGLFSALHRLDEAGLDGIVARLVPETGLGRAVNDRLRRAAARPAARDATGN